MLPNLRNHSGVLLSLFVASVLFAGLCIGCDVFNKTKSTINPGQNVTAAQLQGEVAQKQATFDKLNRAIADTQKSAVSDYQKAILSAQQKYADQMTAEDTAAANLASDVGAYNSTVASAQTDLTAKETTISNVISVLGGVFATAAKGTFDPMSLLTTLPTLAIGALGLGATIDKNNLQVALTNSRANPAINPPASTVQLSSGPVLPIAGNSIASAPAPSPYVLPKAA